MYRLIFLMLLMLFSYSVVDGFNGYETRLSGIQDADSAPGFLQLGYFKDKGGKYILAVKVPTSVSKAEVEHYAKNQAGKTGQPAKLYFFEDDLETPSPGIQADGSSSVKEKLLFSDGGMGKWRYAFLRRPNGTTRTVDCAKYPESDLCRA